MKATESKREEKFSSTKEVLNLSLWLDIQSLESITILSLSLPRLKKSSKFLIGAMLESLKTTKSSTKDPPSKENFQESPSGRGEVKSRTHGRASSSIFPIKFGASTTVMKSETCRLPRHIETNPMKLSAWGWLLVFLWWEAGSQTGSSVTTSTQITIFSMMVTNISWETSKWSTPSRRFWPSSSQLK